MTSPVWAYEVHWSATASEALAAMMAGCRAELSAMRGGPELIRDIDIQRLAHEVSYVSLTLVGAEQVIGPAGYGVGWLTASETFTVGELWVTPPARGIGIGHELLAAIRARARSLGAQSVESFALPGLRQTKNFFEAHGMKTRLLTVSANIEAPSD